MNRENHMFRGYCQNLGIPDDILSYIADKYDEPHRHFHTRSHVTSIIKRIMDEKLDDESSKILTYVALFHDVVYEPWNPKESYGVKITDEQLSAEILKQAYEDNIQNIRNNITSEQLEQIMGIIKQTSDHSGEDKLSMLFNVYDTAILSSKNFSELIEYEHGIFREFSFMRIDLYVKHRCEFLRKHAKKYPLLEELAKYVESREYRIAFYPGSFNPFHIGHLDILMKAEKLFDKVIVLQGHNPEKNENLANIHAIKELRKREVTEQWGNIITYMFSTSNPVSKYNPVLVRGVRNSHDLLYEDNYVKFCKEIHPNLQSVIILCDQKYSHISSSSIRGLSKISPELYKRYTL